MENLMCSKKIVYDSSHPTTFVNKLDKNSFALLHYAARYNHLDIVKFLLSCNADPNIKGGDEGLTPLHVAAMCKVSPDSSTGVDQIQDSQNPDTINLFDVPMAAQISHKRQKQRPVKKDSVFDSQGKAIRDYKGPVTKRIKFHELDSQTVTHADTIINALIQKFANINGKNKYDATPVCYAAMKRNEAAITELLEYHNVDIEAKDGQGMTPLHYAAEQGCPRIAKILIDHKANLMASNKFDMTPLHLACEEGHPEVASLILSELKENSPGTLKNYINAKDKNSFSALHYAATSGVVELVSLLLEYGAECTFDQQTDYASPLHLACVSNQLDIVKLLVENNLNIVDVKNQNQETPLMIAASLNRTDILNYLLQHKLDIESIDNDQDTALFFACKKDHLESVKILLGAGAKLDRRNNDDYNPLHVAAVNNALHVAGHLLSTSSKHILQNSWDRYENRPIHLAVMNNHIEMVKLLVDNASPVDEKNASGLTPFLLAASRGYIDILKYLVDISLPLALDEDDRNNTALHLAAENGFHKAIPILVAFGMNVDYRNTQQMTALDLACSKGHYKTALALIESESSIDTGENSKHLSPLLIAAKYGHGDLITLLLNRGADITRIGPNGRNCLEIAIHEKRRDAVMAILNNPKWEMALRHVICEGDTATSPFRCMIETMPDMAEMVLDKCISDNNMPKDNSNYAINCNYEFLEDMHTAWGHKLKCMPKKPSAKSVSILSRITDKISNLMEAHHFRRNNRNHPLSMMVENERYAMLGHPLVRHLEKRKWNSSSSYIYYTKIFILIIYLVFLTGICLASASPPYKCIKLNETITIEPLNHSYEDNIKDCVSCPYIPIRNSFLNYIFIWFGKYFLLTLSSLFITKKVIGLYSNIYTLLSPQAVLEILGAVCSIIYVSGFFSGSSQPYELFRLYRCTNLFRSFGALALCFSWLSFVLYLTKLPKIGIYIIMYIDIFKTFLQFLPVYFMLIISFALPFYMVFLDRYVTNSYVTPFKAFIKTFVATVGEIEYDTFYNTQDETPLPVTYFLLFLFLFANSIILMNLLVGLAVDDIQGVQSKAFLKRVALRVKMSMQLESMLKDTRDRRISLQETIFPNQTKGHPIWSWWEFKSNPFEHNKARVHDQFELAQLSRKEMKYSFKIQKYQIKAINDKLQKLETLLEEVIKRI
ncbi:Transient receptor potential cation channel subfamily A member 1 [Thelohanellus kitauei]|uniref:Transient receptor potential cation channel subfamily A member 1 n=1 Tax=Thelohanellus kitauei TaxID=669202 RepID=A0A0C2MJJ2_THEKT|nr:Transient receptor potential cation channel subfamily A member 1 [Thelohanellus kitauei]